MAFFCRETTVLKAEPNGCKGVTKRMTSNASPDRVAALLVVCAYSGQSQPSEFRIQQGAPQDVE